jgi:ParB family chromosome partitioning protein
MSAAEKRQPLGRGLNALFGEETANPYGVKLASATQGATQGATQSATQSATAAVVKPVDKIADKIIETTIQYNGARRTLMSIPVTSISPSPFQPRRIFSEESINELAASLKQHGMAQPMVVRPKPNTTGQYELIAGERRWRAAQIVPMHEVPVIIQDIDDKTAMEIALIENLQRVDLNPLEEARAFQRLIEEYEYKHDQLATVLGKSRSHITNVLRLLQLPEFVQEKLLDGALTMGHARALITAQDPNSLAELIIKNGLSVRDVERLAAKQKEKVGTPDKIAKAISKAANNSNTKTQKDSDIRALENNLSQLLGLHVSIDPESTTKGSVTIEYQNLDQLDDVLRRLSR